MLLGQLYYYNKLLNSLSFPLTKEQLLHLELAGTPKLELNSLYHLSLNDLIRKLKDLFSYRYGQLLQQESLAFATQFWNNLVSATIPTEKTKLQPKTAFQQTLLSWQEKQFTLELIPELLKEGELTIDLEDFALFYGIKVLAILNQDILNTQLGSTEWQLPETTTTPGSLSTKPNILVLTSEVYAPLFINLNCEYLPISEDLPELLKAVTQTITNNPEIKLILINSDNESIETYLHKYLTSDVLITTIEFTKFAQDAFFDRLVRKTLGVRLT